MIDIACPFCNTCYALDNKGEDLRFLYCPGCGKELPKNKKHHQREKFPSGETAVTLVSGHAPQDEPVQFSIGPYQVIRSIGKGGMGEVFLAYDTTCGRRIALKRIREDLLDHKQIHNRFLKEARVTSQLTHPAIIPIYAIHGENNLIYYTMPFVEGQTLKQIFKDARKAEQEGDKPHFIGGSIPSLVRIFLTICQAVAYAHSKNVLHRDIKPENIIIGKYGEVMILDWGLAKLIRQGQQPVEETTEIHPPHALHQITHLGKVVGTISYMAPERALGQPATFQTDVYSLGVILYQILTLRQPFRRPSLKEFRQNMDKEELYDPIEVAPYREVPRELSSVVLRCLSRDLSKRYHSVDALIRDIENYIEGRSEWVQVAELNTELKKDWEFQENVLIAEHIAITRATEVTDWVSLMISKDSFPENIKIEARLRLGDKCQGLGFLLSIPEAAERVHLNDGYCLWLGSDSSKSTKLLRSTVEVLHAPETVLHRQEWYRVRIEKIENNIHLYLNDILQFSYISHLPLAGTHVGLLARDADFAISPLKIFSGGQSIKISCLAVPDAFLAHKDYVAALSEYRRIGYSFPGRTEGREAMFRAGITLLEQGHDCQNETERAHYYEAALEEFGKLHNTPGAPLEYLGKALVYQTMHDFEEEIKCFELAYRRFPLHPLLPVIHEQLLYRMNESSRTNRLATYNFILLALRFLPQVLSNSNARKIFDNLKKHWEPLYFIEDDEEALLEESLKIDAFALQLAFWLAKPYVITEILQKLISVKKEGKIKGVTTVENALFCLIELGAFEEAKKNLNAASEILSEESYVLLELALRSENEALQTLFDDYFDLLPHELSKREIRVGLFLMRKALREEQSALVLKAVANLKKYPLPHDALFRIDTQYVWASLLEGKIDEAGELLHSYPFEILNQETTALHFLYGTWLYLTEGREIAQIHFSGVLEFSYPRTWALGTHYLNHKITESGQWFKRAFLWEKRQLFRQLALFYRVTGDTEKALRFKELEKECYIQEDL